MAGRAGKKVKRELLNRTDHRLDLSPAGRSLFVSRDKQAQHRAARRIQIWMRLVLVLTIAAVLGAVTMFVLFYLAPWFHSEISVDGSASSGAASAVSAAPVLEYDSMGLPIYSEEICLFVVNSRSPAQKDFAPELSETEGVQVDARIASALGLMVGAARRENIELHPAEGYVSYEEQEKRFEAVVKELMDTRELSTVMARKEAASRQPKPGESDFQSGMCIRLEGDPETFGQSRAWSWLKANMGKYGFVLRYPEYKDEYTGVAFDPTVIRYVGKESALAMQQRSMCLEEYIDYLDNQ